MDCYLSPEQIGRHGLATMVAARDGKAQGVFYIAYTFCLVSDGSLTEHGEKMLPICEEFYAKDTQSTIDIVGRFLDNLTETIDNQRAMLGQINSRT